MRLCVLVFMGLWLPFVAWAGNLPIPEQGPALRLQGSNTIGAALGPALVRGLMEDQGMRRVSSEITGRDNEQRIVGQTADGRRVTVDIAAHGSSTGFAALKHASADLAASSRPIKDSELKELSSLGDLKNPAAEQVIAIDRCSLVVGHEHAITITIEGNA